MLAVKTCVSVNDHRCLLTSAAGTRSRFICGRRLQWSVTSILLNACDLVPHIKDANTGGIYTCIPIKNFSFPLSTKKVRVKLSSPTHFIRQRHNFTTSTTAARVGNCFSSAILVCRNQWPAFPVVGLLGVVDASTVVTTHDPGA